LDARGDCRRNGEFTVDGLPLASREDDGMSIEMDRKSRDALRGRVVRIESHPATPGGLDSRGRDWNSDTLRLFMESGRVVDIEAGCYHFEVRLWEGK
jgi:hypothetical protein